jgi:hypothetical protein
MLVLFFGVEPSIKFYVRSRQIIFDENNVHNSMRILAQTFSANSFTDFFLALFVLYWGDKGPSSDRQPFFSVLVPFGSAYSNIRENCGNRYRHQLSFSSFSHVITTGNT